MGGRLISRSLLIRFLSSAAFARMSFHLLRLTCRLSAASSVGFQQSGRPVGERAGRAKAATDGAEPGNRIPAGRGIRAACT